MTINPVSYAIDTVRGLFSGNFLFNGIIELFAMAIAVLIISVYVFRRNPISPLT